MIKSLIMFVFGNALWDALVDYFGSTQGVIEAAVVFIVVLFIIKYFKHILIFFVVVIFIIIYLMAN